MRMSEQRFASSPGTGFWIIGILSLLWNLLGLLAYYMGVTATPEQLAATMSPEQVALIEATPKWVTSANAIAVTGGVIASILLLLRKKLALPLFGLSLAAVIVQDIFVFGMSDSIELFGMQPVVIQGLVLLIGIFMLWFARKKAAEGVLT
jgi:hypothetical protein